MRTSSQQMRSVLTGASFTFRFVADVIANGQRVLQDLPCTAPDFTDDDGQQVQSTGSLTFVYQDDFAKSIAPTGVGDVLSPFGTQVWVYVLVEDGPAFSERVRIGQYLVTSTPTINTTRMLFMGAAVTVGDEITVSLSDLLYGVQVNRFDVPGSPPSLTSTWSEVQRLTGLPLTRSIPDAAISTQVAYQEDRLQAVYDLANYSLDAVPYITPDGTVSMRPNAWPAVVDRLTARHGNLIDVKRSLVDDQVYNAIVVRSYDTSKGTAILASGELTSGPLRARETDGSLSPFRRRPKFYSSQYLTTVGQAQAYVNTWLPRVSQLTGVEVVLTETFNPLREVGDVLTVAEIGNTFNGRVTRIRRTDAAQQETTVAVTQ
ncbi:hypothetical protein GA0004736_3422 [Curtobacterium sp. 9128]|uniref:hypothetical protein n=1 Tax=Curtobacterium sp. 9128 TaxID=1793722 RepID=UPI0007D7107A|nr:hypothetical protein [Curtobacterium sp. 9128]SBN64462.1 hypothetical protein GA0004736_3422 [Curtobacterium sp. 9128]